MTQPIHLIVYVSPLFPAHWALWLPRRDEPTKGRRIHATGDARNGFAIDFDRGYDLADESRRYQLVHLADVDAQLVRWDWGAAAGGERLDANGAAIPLEVYDQQPIDRLEEVALLIHAPGPSLVPSSSTAVRQRVEIANCQTWLRDVVDKYVEMAIMSPAAGDIIRNAPRN